jgi:hypothetical protein
MRRLHVILVSLVLTIPCWAQAQQPPATPTAEEQRGEFRQLLVKLAPQPADPCQPPYSPDLDLKPIESAVLERATRIVISELNLPGNAHRQPAEVAATALKSLERSSAEINLSWPDENRFHSQVLDLQPILVTKLTIRAHHTFVVLGVPHAAAGKPSNDWQQVGSDHDTGEHDWPPSSVDLYPVKRGPSGHARFLARLIYSGCAGSYGVAYDAREWDPAEFGGLSQVIKQEGSFGLDSTPAGAKPSAKYPFAQIGELRTDGGRITLPFCWFSAIDTWDHPSMCAVDTYDVSGNQVKFISRGFNRPDLLPIAKALEHAEQRDYPAVLAYCASAEVAQKLLRDTPPHGSAEDLRVTRISQSKERVQLGPNWYRFEVEKRGDRWLIVSFRAE